MLDLTGLPVLDIAIGLSFFYFLLSIVASSISEIVASIFRLRASNLEAGIRALVGDPAKATQFFADWRIKALHTPSGRKPSYVLPRTAALAIIDTLAPNAAAEARKVDPGQPASQDVLKQITDHVESDVADGDAKKWLLDAFTHARGDIDTARAHVEDRFNEVMDRATGWYKRKVQIILFVIALASQPVSTPTRSTSPSDWRATRPCGRTSWPRRRRRAAATPRRTRPPRMSRPRSPPPAPAGFRWGGAARTSRTTRCSA
jgi:hypothetical protein